MADPLISFDELEELEKKNKQQVQVEAPAFVPKAATPKARDPNKSFAGTVITQDWFTHSGARALAGFGIASEGEDFDFERDFPQKEWEESTEGLSDTAKSNIAMSAKNRGHLYYLIDLAKESEKNEEFLASYGAWGVAGRIGVDIFDPTNVALAMTTGGIGVPVKAARLAQAAKVATTVADRQALKVAAEAALKGGHAIPVAKSALAAATEAGLLQAVANEGDPTRDGWDIAYAAIGAGALGAGAGRWASGAERKALNELHGKVKSQLLNAEAKEAVAAARKNIASRLGGDVEAARGEVARATRNAAQVISNQHTDLATYPSFRHILESNGKANAKSPTSSATGIDQFVDETWLGVVSQAKPQWAKGLSRGQLLELRKDPVKSAEMVAVLDADNARVLRGANAPVNHFTMYAMHHFGPSKGKRFALAKADEAMENILSAKQLNANKYLKGLTKAEAMQVWAGRAAKGGVDLRAMVKNVASEGPHVEREARILATDRPDLQLRLKQAEETLAAHEADVAKRVADAEGIANENPVLPQGQQRKLQREVDRLQKELSDHRGTSTIKLKEAVAALEAKLAGLGEKHQTLVKKFHEEDIAKLGPEVANNKQRAKLREGSAKTAIEAERKAIALEMRKAKETHGRARYSLREALQEPQRALQSSQKGAAARAGLKALLGDPEVAAKSAAHRNDVDALKKALDMHDSDVAAKAAEDTARSEADALLQTTAGKQADLDQLDNLDVVDQAVDLRGQQLDATGYAAGYGEDTLSAARASGITDSLFPALSGTSSAPMGKMKLASMQRLWGKGTFAGVLRGNENQVVNDELGVMVGNTVGNVGDTLNTIGASEISTNMQKAMGGKFHAAVTPSYEAWMKEMDVPGRKKWHREIRDQYMKEVGLHIRGQASESPAVKAAAGRIKEVFAEFLTEAKAAGVKGFENVDINGEYLPRVFNFHKLHDLLGKVHETDLARLMAKAIQQVNEDMDDEVADKIGAAYIKRMRNLRVGNDVGLMQGMSFDDVVFLRQFLNDAEMGSDEVESIVAKFASAKRGNGTDVMNKEGNFRHAKMRQQYDENFTLEFRDKSKNDGTLIPVTVSDLLENNVETLFGRYSRTMSGHTALAKVGIKSRADFEQRMNRVRNALEHDKDALEDVEKKANAAYDIITARPLSDSNLWTEMMRTGRDLSYATQMENAGLANLPDLASLVSWGNLKYTADAFFSGDIFGAFWRRGQDGRMMDDFMQELEETTGLGTDFLNNQIYSSYDVADDFATNGGRSIANRVSGGFSAVSHGARVASRAVTVGSGLAGLTSLSQRLAARNIVYRLKDSVIKGKGFSEARAAALGIDNVMKERIAGQLKKHTQWIDGEYGGKIHRVDFVKWDDVEARDAFLYAVQKEARKSIQEEDLGDTFYFMHTPMGKFLTQFRRFGLTAYTKQTMRGIAEHDAEAMTRAALQAALAGGVFWARNEMKAKGMEFAGVDQDKIDKFREQNLTPGRIGAAALRNSGFASLAPDLYDTTVGKLTGVPVFDVRNSGNSSSLASIPTLAMAGNIGTAATGTFESLIREDRQFDQGEARALQSIVPFADNLLIAPVIQALSADLPKSDEDDDTDEVDWVF